MTDSGPPQFVIVLAEDPAVAAELGADLARRPGWAAPAPIDLPGRLGRLLWGFEAGRGSAGVSALADRATFDDALRRLATDIVVGMASGSPFCVDVTPDGERLGPYLRAVWPHATVVAVVEERVSAGVAAAVPDVVVTSAEVRSSAADVGSRVVAAATGAQPSHATTSVAPDDTSLLDRLVIVLGAGRSGTTWLHRLLCANPAIAGTETGETWLFPDVAPLWDDVVRSAVGGGPLLGSLRRFCDALLGAMRERVAPHASHVCEKTPATVWKLPMVAALYPDAHFVHIVRDGRDTAASLALTRGAAADPVAAAREWVEAVGAIRAIAPSLPRFREVRYEDLLANPVSVVDELWEWIGLARDDAARSAAASRSGERVTPLRPSGEIGSGKWQELPDDVRDEVDAVTRDLMRELGYPAGRR